MTETRRLVSIIIPVHNRKALTLQCLEGLRWCAKDAGWKVILVDDASTDGTGEAVRAQHPHVEIVEGNGELFWTGAMRVGMARALELGSTEVVWLNDDTLPEEPSVRRIAKLVQEDAGQIVASTALRGGVPQACCGLKRRGLPPVRGMLQQADVLAGYQVAFPVVVLRKIGLPDAHRWPHYGGDSSYTRLALKAGFRLMLDGDSFVILNDGIQQQDIAKTFWKNQEDLGARIRRVFFGTGSRYRLRTVWHLDLLYRGWPAALVVFPTRLLVDLWKILRHPRSETAATAVPETAS